MGNGVLAVPAGGVVIAGGGDNDGSHDGGDVEVWPCEHFVEDSICSEVVANSLHTILHGDSTLVVDGFRLITIVVGLNDKPSSI